MVVAVLTLILLAVPNVKAPKEARHIDPAAVERGLELRLGNSADAWSLELAESDLPNLTIVRFRSPKGYRFERGVTLAGDNNEDRSRELASAIALIIAEYVEKNPEEAKIVVPEPDPPEPEPEPPEPEPEPPEPEPEPPKPKPKPAPIPPSGWIAIGPRIGVGPPGDADLDAGLDVRGGAWLVRDLVQPVIAVGWARSSDLDLTVDGVRFGAGVHVGYGGLLRRQLWIGGGAMARGMWVRAEAQKRPTEWTSSTEVAALVQYRNRWIVAGLRLAVDIVLPPIRATGQTGTVEWGPARFMAGLEVGIRLPPGVTR